MIQAKTSPIPVSAFWIGWRRWTAWLICIAAILLLGAVRISTDAEFTFASLALLPVIFIAWIGGKKDGLCLAFVAAAMWAVADFATEQKFSLPWVPWANAVTRLLVYSMVAYLAARVRLQLDREHQLATVDALTGLQNRRAFFAAGAAEVERSKRYAHPLAVAFLDLDDFKQLNDRNGHAAGDAALQAAAAALVRSLRLSDRVARLGGDEFAVVLPEIGYDAADVVARKIFTAVTGALRDYSPVKASLGLVWFGEIDRPFTEMLKAADELMYEVKGSGKNNMRSRRITGINRAGVTS